MKNETENPVTGDVSKPVLPKYPSETIDLPSKGLVYPESNPLSKGSIEMKYMTAREEDILTSQNLIQKGIVIDRLLESLIISDINYDDLITGDKNAIMVAARVLGYGKDYKVEVTCPLCDNKEFVTVDLTTLTDREIDDSIYNRINEYEYTLPKSKRVIKFKLLTHADERKIAEEVRAMKTLDKKLNKKESTSKEFSVRISQIIIAVDGNRDNKFIRNFVENEFLGVDSLEFRKHLKEIAPDINMTFKYTCTECGGETVLAVPMTVEFFWPNAGL